MIGLTLLWVYLRRHEAFTRFRNTILLANLIGLLGFSLMPTAPPWMFPGGFVDGVNHSSALLHPFGNQYAAMPSLHAADALIVGFFLVVRLPHLWAKVALGDLAASGSGSASSRRRTTTSSTCSPGSCGRALLAMPVPAAAPDASRGVGPVIANLL